MHVQTEHGFVGGGPAVGGEVKLHGQFMPLGNVNPGVFGKCHGIHFARGIAFEEAPRHRAYIGFTTIKFFCGGSYIGQQMVKNGFIARDELNRLYPFVFSKWKFHIDGNVVHYPGGRNFHLRRRDDVIRLAQRPGFPTRQLNLRQGIYHCRTPWSAGVNPMHQGLHIGIAHVAGIAKMANIGIYLGRRHTSS